MADVTISYKGSEIASMSATGTKTLLTEAKYCEDDITVAYTKPSAPSPTYQAKTNITPTTSSQTITADAGYDALSSVQINAMPSGSASTPATTITANPTISVVNNGSTAQVYVTVSASQSITPTVAAGYVSSGTAGTVTVSGSRTELLTSKAAATYTPTTADQTIASGQYLTGAQTIKGDANLLAENIKKDVSIFSVVGTYEGGGGGGEQLFILTQAPGYSDVNVEVNGASINMYTAFYGSTVVPGATIAFSTYGDYVLDSITGMKSGNPIPFTTVQRGRYTFTMPNESVNCVLYYDD